MSILKKSSPLRLKNRRAKQRGYSKRFAQQCARAEELRDGSHGAASEVRHIDSRMYNPPPPKSVTLRPKSAAQIEFDRRARLDRQARKLTGMR
jgi:hypothetical protein